MKARSLAQKFEAGEDISAHVDWSRAKRPNVELKRVNVDFPRWVIEALDQEAQRTGRNAAVFDQALDRRAIERLAQSGLIGASAQAPHPNPLPVCGERESRSLAPRARALSSGSNGDKDHSAA